MTTTETFPQRPATPREAFTLYELTCDGELVATGSNEQMCWERATMTDQNPGERYEVVQADITGCAAGRAGRHCPASVHAMH